jgi:CBS domain-containing protein
VKATLWRTEENFLRTAQCAASVPSGLLSHDQPLYIGTGGFATAPSNSTAYLACHSRPRLCVVQEAADPAGPQAKRRRGRAPAPPAPPKGVLTCQATSTLAEVIAIMSLHSVHNVYVVDPDSKPLCAITMADVLRVIVDSVPVCKTDTRATVAALPVPGDLLGPVVPISRLESATSAQSGERGASVCTSVQSEHQAVNSKLGGGK